MVVLEKHPNIGLAPRIIEEMYVLEWANMGSFWNFSVMTKRKKAPFPLGWVVNVRGHS